MNDILNLAGKVAVITGAGQGVGRQIALHFAAHGAGGVVVNDYYLDRAEAVAAEIVAAGGRALAVEGDVTNPRSVATIMAAATEEFDGIDVLVNNAGNAGATPTGEEAKPFWETGPQVWDSHIAVNFYGVLNCTAAAIPTMIGRGGGNIITVISDAGRVGEAGLEIYSGAKAGAAGFMRAVARSLGRHAIRANCISIAATRTPTVAAALDGGDPAQLKRALERYVIRRAGEPVDVANMALFLASDASSWVTGQTYPVNGGFSFSL
ncbi:SDR family NAD(P)-dependent oxidoreductase [Nocardia sp. SC052]|uniref:SDR family NAD(P)-dependent oxidoreductase n=1 Tax=Nocardia sichangensis TaxID=3385975 RepID=UPI0039A24290